MTRSSSSKVLPAFLATWLLAWVVFPAHVAAQGTARGSIVGTVTDQSRGVVPKATITVINTGTGIRQTTAAEETGTYAVPNLPVGNYKIEAEAPGFKKSVVEDVRLQVGATFRADITLEVGEVTTHVRVEAVTPVLKTDNADVSHVIEQRRVVDLPLNGRDFQQLQLLTPGAISGVNFQTGLGLAGGAGAVGNSGTMNVSNGARGGSQLFLLDGAYASNRQGRTIIVTPTVDEIEEFRVAGSGFSAEYGYGTNVINVSTKAGTNGFHGTVYEFHRNDALAARSYFARSVGVLRRNQFGASVGGPVRKDQSFFFFTYEGQRQRTTSTLFSTVPTARMRSGNLSELSAKIYDPLTSRIGSNGVVSRDEFPGNVIPAGRIDPVSALFLEWVPLPNLPGTVANFINEPRPFIDYNHWNVRIDHRLTARDSLMGRWTSRRQKSPAFGSYHGFSKDQYSPGTTFRKMSGTNIVLSWVHSFSPTTMLEVRPSYSTPYNTYVSPNIGIDWTSKAGIQGFGPGISDVFPTFPSFAYSGFTGLGNGVGFDVRHHSRDITGNLTLVRGKHLIKAGATFAAYLENIYPYGQGEGGFSYTGGFTTNPSVSGASGSGLADYLLGFPFAGSRYVPPGKYYIQLRNTWSYIQDDWKVTPRLTLNLGLRHEINFPTTEKYDQLATFSPYARGGKGAMVVPDAASISEKNWGLHSSVPLSLSTYRPLIVFASDIGVPPRSMRPTNFKQFAPRFGFAYRLKKDWVVRGGYGIYINQLDGNRETEFLSPPFLIRESNVLNVIDVNGAPTRTTRTLFPKESKFSPEPVVLGHDPWVRGYGYTQQWNLMVQKLLPGGFSVETGYVGTKGTRLQTSRNINAPLPGPGAIQPRRPFPEFLTVTWNEQSASSTYHSMQTKVERRFHAGLILLAAFTWSKNIDNSSDSAQGCTNPYDCSFDRGPSAYDAPANFVLSSIYDLPFFRTGATHPLLKHALGGWSLSGILTLRSGLPFTPLWAGDVPNIGVGSVRPDRVCDGRIDNPTVQRWFDTSCFVAPKQFTFGNTGRNILRGDGIENLDLGIYKEFRVLEGHRLQFRAEMFNAMNHADFTFPATVVNRDGAGSVFGSGPGRIVQFGLKYLF